MVEAIFLILGSQSLLHLGYCLQSAWLSKGSLVLIAAFSVRSNFLLYLAVVSIVVLSHPVVREWWRRVSFF